MYNGKSIFTLFAAVVVLVAGITTPALAQPSRSPMSLRDPGDTSKPAVFARASYLIDVTTGEVRLSRRAEKRMPVASLTKVMTAYIVVREAQPTETVRIRAGDTRYAANGGGTTADLRVGDRLTVHDLLYALMLPSGADAAHALARTFGPGIDGFTDRMNATARELGMTDTHYVNADGLPTPGGDGYSTARDQALLADAALRDPAFEAITSTRRHSVAANADHRAYTWTNTNKLLGASGAVGVKTGFTRAAGYCLTFAADRDGRRLVGVLLGESVSSRRFQTAESLLDWASATPAEGKDRSDLSASRP
ncbi:D-alanyl-D-alanine carboxypeptidase family protein [Streptosporangium sp. KLBMP 9127]|nr:D-alanyl-D-alanine carboxypeptidase [Streptosporangium sp. KLBMP 9127]